MEDLIRRSDAKDAVIEWYGCKPNDIEAFEKIIEAIPSAESTGDLDNAIYEYVQDGLMSNPYDRPQDDDWEKYSDKLWKNAYERGKADRPQGEWRDLDGNFVPLDKDGCTTASAWCSNCGEWLTGSDEYWTSGRFCPNCGARMLAKDTNVPNKKGADDE